MLNPLRDKNARHVPYGGGGRGEKSLLCHLGSRLRPGGREDRSAENIKWDGRNKKQNKNKVGV